MDPLRRAIGLGGAARSGLSMRAFAERERVDEQRLRRRARRLASAGASSSNEVAPKFVEIARRGTAVVEVVPCSDRVLRVSDAIDPGKLRRLVDALDEGTC